MERCPPEHISCLCWFLSQPVMLFNQTNKQKSRWISFSFLMEARRGGVGRKREHGCRFPDQLNYSYAENLPSRRFETCAEAQIWELQPCWVWRGPKGGGGVAALSVWCRSTVGVPASTPAPPQLGISLPL